MKYSKLFTFIIPFVCLSISKNACSDKSYRLGSVQEEAKKAIEKANKLGWLNGIDKPINDEASLKHAKEIADKAVIISSSIITPDQKGFIKKKDNFSEGMKGALFISFSMSM